MLRSGEQRHELREGEGFQAEEAAEAWGRVDGVCQEYQGAGLPSRGQRREKKTKSEQIS